MYRYSHNLIELARVLIVICVLALAHSPAQAENANKTEQAISSEQLIDEIARAQANVKNLEQRLAVAEGFFQIAMDSRLLHAQMDLLERNLAFLVQVTDDEKAGRIIGPVFNIRDELIQAIHFCRSIPSNSSRARFITCTTSTFSIATNRH